MKKDYMKHIFALLLFGSNGIVAKNIALTSYEIVFWRTVIGSVFLITLFFISKKEITFTKNKKDLIFIALSGIAMGASWMFLYEAYVQIGVSIATLVYYCGPVIVMMLLNTGIGCYLYFSSIGELPVQTVAICGYLEPLSAVIFAVIILKERMLPIQIMGAVLIIGGAIFGECYKKVKV